MKKALFILFGVLFIFCGCTKNPQNKKSEVNITISEAETIAYQTIGDNDLENQFICESIKIIDNRIFYLIRGFNNVENKTTTFGWYLVDVSSGNMYDTGPGQNEMILISN